MSNTVDNRVVSMEFDNAKFEKNVETSLNTLKHLDQSLDSLTNGSKAFDGVSFENLANQIDNIASRFTLMGRITMKVFDEIAGGIVNLGKKIVSFNTDQLESGWGKYADKTTSVQTIMSATGMTIEDVSAQLERLNRFTDETSYSFTEMTSNIAKFTSQGIGLETAVTQMQGIATWAASAGQDAQAASRAMYNISQAMGAGSMKLIDWKSIQNANMATKAFKEQAIAAGVSMGTLEEKMGKVVVKGTALEVTAKNFEQTLQKGWFDTSTMQKVFGDYGKFADVIDEMYMKYDENITVTDFLRLAEEQLTLTNEDFEESLAAVADNAGLTKDQIKELREDISLLNSEELKFSKKTYEDAQQAKTFTDALNAAKDAVSTSWMNVFETIFGNYEKARVLWTDLANWFYYIFADPINSLNNVLDTALNIDFWNDGSVKNNIKDTALALLDFGDAAERAFKELGIVSDEDIEKFGGIKEAIKNIDLSADQVGNVIDNLLGATTGASKGISTLEDARKIVNEIWHGKFGSGQERRDALAEAGYDPVKMQNVLNKLHYGIKITEEDLTGLQIGMGEFSDEQIKALVELKKSLEDGTASLSQYEAEYSKLTGRQLLFDEKVGAFYNLMEIVKNVKNTISDAWNDIFGKGRVERIYNVISAFQAFTMKIRNSIKDNETFVKSFEIVFTVLKIGGRVVKDIADGIVRLLNAIKPSKEGLSSFINTVHSLVTAFDEWLAKNSIIQAAIDVIVFAWGVLRDAVDKLIVKVKELINNFANLDKIQEMLQWFASISKTLGLTGLADFFENLSIEKLIQKFKEAKDAVSNFFKVFSRGKKEADKNSISVISFSIKGLVENVNEWLQKNGIFKKTVEVITSAFDRLKNVLSPVTNKIKEFIEKTGQGDKIRAIAQFFSTFGKSLNLENIKREFENLSLEKVINGFKNARTSVSDFFKTLLSGDRSAFADKIGITSLIKGFNTLKTSTMNWLSDHHVLQSALDGLKTAFYFLKDAIGPVVDKFKELVDQSKYSDQMNSILGWFKALNEKLNTNGFMNFFDSVNLDQIINIFTTAKNTIADFFDTLLHNSKTEAAVAIIDETSDRFKVLSDAVKKAKDVFSGWLQNINTEALGKIGIFAIKLLTLVTLIKSLKSFTKGVTSILKGLATTVGNAATGVLNVFKSFNEGVVGFLTGFTKEFSRFNKANARKQTMDGILKIAESIAILAAVLALLSFVPAEKLKNATIILGIIMGAVAAYIILVGAFSNTAGAGNMAKIGASLATFVASISLLVGALFLLTKMNYSNILPALGILLVIIGMLTGVAIAMSKFDVRLTGSGIALISFSLGLILLVKALKTIQTDARSIGVDAFNKLFGLIMILIGMGLAMKRVRLGSALGIIALAASLIYVQKAIRRAMKEAIGIDEFNEYFTKLMSVFSILLGLSLILRISGKGSLKTILSILALIGLMIVIAATIKKLGKMLDGDLLKGAGAVSTIGLILLGLMLVLSSMKKMDKSAMKSVRSVIIGLVAVMASLIILATFFKWDDLKYPLLSISVILGLFTLVLFALSKFMKSEDMKAGNVASLAIVIIGLIAIFAALFALSKYIENPEALLNAAISMSAILLALSTAFYILSKSNIGSMKLGDLGKAGLAMAGLGLIVAGIALLLPKLNEMPNIDGLLPKVAAISTILLALSGCVLLLSYMPHGSGGPAAVGVLVVAEMIGVLGAIFGAFGYLIDFINGQDETGVTDAASWIIEGAEVLGEAIGKFVGAFIGGILSGAVGAAADLTSFTAALEPFIDQVSRFDSTSLSGVTALTGLILALAAADLVSAINAVFNPGGWLTSLFGGESNDMASKLTKFAGAVKSYIDALAELDAGEVYKVSRITEAISSLLGNMPKEGGIFSAFTGSTSTSFKRLGKNMGDFGAAIKGFIESVSDIPSDAATKTDNAVKAANQLVEFSKTLQKSGGLIQSITGITDIGLFGEQLGKFVTALFGGGEGENASEGFFKALDKVEIDDAKIQKISDIKTALDPLVEIARQIPTMGGLIEDVIGTQDPATFTDKMAEFIKGIKKISEEAAKITDDDIEKIRKAKEAALATSELNAAQNGQNIDLSMPTVTGGVGSGEANGITAAFASIENTIGKVDFEGISSKVNSFKESISNAFGSIDASPMTELSSAITGVTDSVTGLTGAFDVAGPDFVESFSGLTALPEQMGTTLGDVTATFDTNAAAFQTSAKTFFGGLPTAIDETKGEAVAKADELIGSTTASLNNGVAAVTTTGFNFAAGFAEGIKNGTYLAELAAQAMVSSAKAAADAAQQSNSPSKLLMKSGSYFSQGFAIGIMNEGNTVRDAATKIVNVAADSVKTAAQMINEIIEDDASPVIRPVIDLSGVREGANAITALTSGELSRSVAMQMTEAHKNNGTVNQNGSNYVGPTYNIVIDGIKYNTDDYVDTSIQNFVETIIRKNKMYTGR